MTIRIDPEGNEISLLKQAGSWKGRNVIEIGCGDGRLTLRIARLGAGLINALDPSADLIRTARKNQPVRLGKRIHYKVGSAEKLNHPSNSFDIALFSWVL